MRAEYRPPPDIQRQIDELQSAPPGGEQRVARHDVKVSPPARIEANLLAEIVVKLERAFLSSEALAVSFSAFLARHREAAEEFMRSLPLARRPDDVKLEQLLQAVTESWKHHAVFHATRAADIYNQAVAIADPKRRSAFIDEEVESFVHLNTMLLSSGESK